MNNDAKMGSWWLDKNYYLSNRLNTKMNRMNLKINRFSVWYFYPFR